MTYHLNDNKDDSSLIPGISGKEDSSLSFDDDDDDDEMNCLVQQLFSTS